jgi:nucleoside-diphosphate-sugar epimerase
MSVVILGGGGFLGRDLTCRLAASDVSVRAVPSSEIDLTQADAVERLSALFGADDAVVMTACITPDKGRDLATLMKNIRMGQNVCGALLRKPPGYFLYISSDAVYDARHRSVLDKNASCEPTSLYALAHIAREKMLADVCASRQIPFLAVRPCAIYGAGDTHDSYGPNRFIRSALAAGTIVIFGEGEELRHHIYVRDVCSIIELCLSHRQTGIVNAIAGQAISFLELAQLVAAAVGRGVRLDHVRRSVPITHRCYDTSALFRSFPHFSPTSLSAGIAETVATKSVSYMPAGKSNWRTKPGRETCPG